MTETSEMETARDEITNILWKQAKDTDNCLISYSDLAKEITTIDVEPYSQVLWGLLGEISTETYQSDEVMLSALVVESSNNIPGSGFWALARLLGALPDNSTPMDNMSFWAKEVKKIIEISNTK